MLLENNLLELTLLDRAWEQREHTSPLSKERVLGQQCEHQTGSENRGKSMNEKNLRLAACTEPKCKRLQRGHRD